MENEFIVNISSKKLGKTMCGLTESFLVIGSTNSNSESIQLSNLNSIELKKDTLCISVKRAATEFKVRMSNKNEKILHEWDKILKNFFLKSSSKKIKRDILRKEAICDLQMFIETKNIKKEKGKTFGDKSLIDLQKDSDLTFIEIIKNSKKDDFFDVPILGGTTPNLERKSFDLKVHKKVEIARRSETPSVKNYRRSLSNTSNIPITSEDLISQINQERRISESPKNTRKTLICTSDTMNRARTRTLDSMMPQTLPKLKRTELTMPHFKDSIHNLLNDLEIPKKVPENQDVPTIIQEKKNSITHILSDRKRSFSFNQFDFKLSDPPTKNSMDLEDYKNNVSFDEISSRKHSGITDFAEGGILYKDDFEFGECLDIDKYIKKSQENEFFNSKQIDMLPSKENTPPTTPNSFLSNQIDLDSLDSPKKDQNQSNLFHSGTASESSKTESDDSRSPYHEEKVEPFHVWNQTFQKAFDYIHNKDDMGDGDVIEYQKLMCNIEFEFITFSKKFGEIIINELYTPPNEKTVKPTKMGGIIGKFFFFFSF